MKSAFTEVKIPAREASAYLKLVTAGKTKTDTNEYLKNVKDDQSDNGLII